MYSSSEIRSAARKTSQGEADLKKTERQLSSDVQETASWWKGKAGSAFKDDFTRQTKSEITRLYAEIRDIESGLERLAREVQIADERRRAEEARRALELQKQQKGKG
ncbi:WXG100 family type VII secretion target [Paenibacillus motobuensis]|uniref:WXG100 family type VII secretion target n=1 Tax=Paenibacillus TaxID=44249 RepID=UPI002040C523|nr:MULTISPECIES: WXG100 family type VII secretion target [Paenibacillus]MCM3040895.1 WXG100 family type VII secretion target [Paenibacillus lutimineralis]MCM3647999.1 WXG100 family type VII secretion target [Paenibacillus motobuensis]